MGIEAIIGMKRRGRPCGGPKGNWIALMLRAATRAAPTAILLALMTIPSFAKYEQEQLAIEAQLQQRIEGILAKTLQPSSYIVTVKVEMTDRALPNQVRTQRSRPGANPFLNGSQFMLPGVPQKKEFIQAPEASTEETVSNAFSAETLVRKIVVTVLVSPDVSPEQIRGLRDVISASIPFNPLRGDEMEIQNSPLLARASSSVAAANNAIMAASPTAAERPARGNFMSSLSDRTSIPLLLILTAVAIILTLLLVFLFGPVRAFLNRLLAVLPRVGEQAAYAVSNAKPATTGATVGMNGSNIYANGARINGNGNGNGEGVELPFHFIREDHLTKLPILFRQMPPLQTALVLAYLPPEWASRVLGSLDPVGQTAVMRELAQAREVPPEAVKEIEAQVKGKLPYLVGGTEWIQSVYQLTQPQTQRVLLGTLNSQAPELAQSLRRQSFFFEDLGVVAPGGLRQLVQEAGYTTMAAAMRDENQEFKEGLLRKLPAAMREIVQQELELSVEDKTAMADAKVRVVSIARRLIVEGRLSMPEKK